MAIKNGIDNIDSVSFLKNKRLGLITNPTGVNKKLQSTIDILAEKYHLVALYGPEHGIKQDKQAGDSVKDDIDEALGIPVFSLYGDHKRLTDKMLNGVDMVVYDMQDVGARFYTYIYTLGYAMEECAKRDIPLVVLSRMNPLGCTICEGYCIRKDFDSFVGSYALPVRYAMTSGQLATYIRDKYVQNCKLLVVPCTGISRNTIYSNGSLPWVMPSPNIPTFESALAYIGTCLFEGTHLSEGRGTTRPFELIGAPFVNAPALVKAMSSYKLPGILFRETHFKPTFSKHANEICHGLQLHITNYHSFRPYKTGLLLLQEIARQFPHLELIQPHFDRLAGDDFLQSHICDVTPVIQRAEEEQEIWFNANAAHLDMF